jgi:2-phosphoglycerate kinase
MKHRAIIIGGTSHTGKSTLARALAERLGRRCRSTDKLARHPGRPWAEAPRQVPPHVAEHYLSLEPDELLADVLRHYRRNVWPQVERILASDEAPGLVLEGSAVLPEPAAALDPERAAGLWLTAEPDVIRRRIRRSSRWASRTKRGRLMIERFLERALLFDAHVVRSARLHSLPLLTLTDAIGPQELADRALAALEDQPRTANPNPRPLS